MRYLILFLLPTILQGQNLQLAPPQFIAGDVFFSGKTTVLMEFALKNATIRYALNDNPTEKSTAYTQPLVMHKSVTLKAISCHPDFLPSTVAEQSYVAAKYRPDSIQLMQSAHEKYPGKGGNSFCDFKKGSTNLQDGNWLGFPGSNVVVEAFFSDKIACKKLVLSTLLDYNAWILPFRKVVIEGENRNGSWVEIGQWELIDAANIITQKAEYAKFCSIKLRHLKTKKIRIKIEPFGNLPQGHPGAGTPAWLFLDEIIFQ